jgi:hypothetical protein
MTGELASPLRAAQLVKSLFFDLPDTLAREF